MSENTGITALNPQQTAAQEAKTAKDGYVHDVLVELDDLGNVVTGGLPDETISSRLARDAEKHDVVGEVGSKILDVFQKDHGAKAIAGDEERAVTVAKTEEASGVLE